MKIDTLKAIEKRLSKDPRFAGIVVQMKQLRLNKEVAQDQKEFFTQMVGLMTDALEKTKEATAASSPGDLMVKNVDTAALMVEVMKDFVASVADKEMEQSLVDQLKALTTGMDSLRKNMEEIAGRKMPVPQVTVEQKVFELKVPEPVVMDQTKIIQETVEAKKQTSLLEKLLSSRLIKGIVESFISNTEPDEAIPVRLVSKDGRDFIDPRVLGGGFFGGGGEAGPSTVTVDNFPTSFEVSNFPTSYEISNDAGNPVPVSGTVAVSNFPSSFEIANDSGNPIPVNGTVEVTNDSGNPLPVNGTVEITNDVGNAIPVTPSTTGVSAAQTTATPIAQSTTAADALASNANRNFATITNLGSARAHINMGAAATANDPDYIDYGDTWTTPIMKDGKVSSAKISIIWEGAGSGTALVSEI